MRLDIAGDTSIGNRYRANFDVLHMDPLLPLVVVADGMGDGRGSAAAGRIAVDTFVTAAQRAGSGTADCGHGSAALRAAVADAQSRVRAAGAELSELTGCTLTALVGAGDGSAWIVHIGDSRAYRLRYGVLELLTVDHTYAWLGAVYGWYPADSREAAAARYHLIRYIGHPDVPEPDILNVSLRPGDVYCLCTDGLAEQVSYQRLGQLLGNGAPTQEIATQLTADALAAGGRDNATVAVLRVDPA